MLPKFQTIVIDQIEAQLDVLHSRPGRLPVGEAARQPANANFLGHPSSVSAELVAPVVGYAIQCFQWMQRSRYAAGFNTLV